MKTVFVHGNTEVFRRTDLDTKEVSLDRCVRLVGHKLTNQIRNQDEVKPFFSQTLTGAVLRLYSPTPAPVIAATRNSYSLPSSKSDTVAFSPAIGKSLTFSQSPPGFLFSIW